MIEAIILNLEQKAKLLAMAKALFFEYDIIWYNDYESGQETNVLQLIFENNYEHLDWLEFCLLHIAPKIEQLDTKNRAETNKLRVFAKLVEENINPIDYLYSQFLKLQFK